MKLYILILLMLTLNIFAQTTPSLMIKDGDKTYPLKLSNLKINTKIIGNVAKTEIEFKFFNSLDKIIQGDFIFPLNENDSVYKFGLDINGEIREGVIVEKNKGQEVFESVVRKNIDPGLLEKTIGNNYKTHIYPIPAKGYKTVIIGYEHELVNKDKNYLYSIPFKFDNKIDLFSLNIETLNQNIEPVLSKNELINVKFTKKDNSYILNYTNENFSLNNLDFLIPKIENDSKLIVEYDETTKNNYFYVNFTPHVLTKEKTFPKKLCIFFDSSLSAMNRDINKEIELLSNYAKKLNNFTVEFAQFGNVVEPSDSFVVKNGDIANITKKIKDIKYDGGTQLGAINFNNYKCDEIILSTDGISNFGDNEIKVSKTPVIVINSSKSAEHSYLKYISQKTNGIYINLNNLSIEEALIKLSVNNYGFISYEFNKGDIEEIYPSLPTNITKDFSFAGILLKDSVKIKVNFGFGNNVVYSDVFEINKKNLTSSEIAKRFYAKKKIAELETEYEKNKEEILKLGQKFGIVTRNTSLIILENIEDYIKYKIIPPKSLQEQYFAVIEAEKTELKESEAEHIEQVVEKFNTVKEWWNTKFSQKNPNIEEETVSGTGDLESETVTLHGTGTASGGSGQSYGYSSGNGGSIAKRAEIKLEIKSAEVSVSKEEASSDKNKKDDKISSSKSPIKEEEENNIEESSEIALQEWNPDTPYLTELKKGNTNTYYEIYLKQRESNLNSSAFYLDVADFFVEKKQLNKALKILSNIAEMEIENHQLLRILGHRLNQLKLHKLALYIFKDVLELRKEEPQSYRDLGLTYYLNKEYQQAIDTLYEVIRKSWDDRFADIDLITILEINNIIATSPVKLNLKNIDLRLIKNMPVDVRVVLNWDADNSDMDLWVTDPYGIKCDYSNNKTEIGGYLSDDFTQGYGPEMFMLKKAVGGKYQIEVNYYGNHQQILSGSTTIQIDLYLNYGKANQTKKSITMRLKDEQEVIKVGEFKIKIKNGKAEL